MIPHLSNLSRGERRNAILFLEKENQKWADRLMPVPRDQWTRVDQAGLLSLYRSKEFMVQVFNEGHDGVVVRLSVNRTHVDPATLKWVDGIEWDDLQRLKAECGYGHLEAVEVYPPDSSIVNVANLRHLWVLADRLPFSWRPS